MVRKIAIVSAVIVAVVAASPALAQTPAPAVPRLQDRSDLRRQIYVMESALAGAVTFGAQQLNREIQTISPEAMTLSGDAQARGVYLEGYGVFFDVGVPILRQSMMWSLRTILQQDEKSIRDTIDVLKMQLSAQRDPAKRRPLEDTITNLELRLSAGPLGQRGPQPRQAQGGQAQGVGAAMIDPSPPSVPARAPTPTPTLSAADKIFLQDPNRAYTEAVQGALIDAMIDYAAPMLIGPDEWLTVGARDNEPRDRFAPQDPLAEVVTVLLRIKGADLAAYRTGKIDREEAKKRVQIGEF